MSTVSNLSNAPTCVDHDQENKDISSQAGELEQGYNQNISEIMKLPKLPDRAPFEVRFNGPKDLYDPYNYPLWRKLLYILSAALTIFAITFGSTIFAQGVEDLMRFHQISYAVASLTTSLFILGFASAPIIFGPVSELIGRKSVLIVCCFGYVCFTFGAASARDLQTIMFCRFFSGFVGGGPLIVAPSVLTDLFSQKHRAIISIVSLLVFFSGSMFGAIVGGFVTANKSLGWRWNSYLSGVIGAVALFCSCVMLKETHRPTLLARKAQHLRRETGIWGIYAKQEAITFDWKAIATENAVKPITLMITEPIILLFGLYNGFVYGMLYALLSIIPMVFQGGYRWRAGISQLPFLSMLLGVFVGGTILTYIRLLQNHKMSKANASPIPKAELPPIIVGGIAFVIGILLIGWAGDYPHYIHWIIPIIGAFLIGNGIMSVYLGSMSYIYGCYESLAVFASVSCAFMRCAFGAAFPLFTRQMFSKLTIKWASVLLAGVGILLIAVPLVFYRVGDRVRRRSKYAKE